MAMLVNCSNCHTPLQLPTGARSIRCVICQAITQIAEQRSPAPQPFYDYTAGTTYGYYQHYQYLPPSPAPMPGPALSPYNHALPVQPPPVFGRKKALICGISYKNSANELPGCINVFAKCMKYMLINRFKFPEDSVLMLTGKFLPLLPKES